MQQKKIIFALLSIIYSSTYSMEQNFQITSQDDIEINSTTGFPEDHFKLTTIKDGATIFVNCHYLYDFFLGNFSFNHETKQLSINQTGRVKESDKYFSVLSGAIATRNNAKWTKNESNGRQERFFYVQDIKQDNQSLNENTIILMPSKNILNNK
jgi:hypothetical protein